MLGDCANVTAAPLEGGRENVTELPNTIEPLDEDGAEKRGWVGEWKTFGAAVVILGTLLFFSFPSL